MQKNSIENLEIKLKNARIENEKKFSEYEKIYNKNYKDFLDGLFKSDILGAKRIISAIFQLELLNNKSQKEAFKIALERLNSYLPLNYKQKETLKQDLLFLENKKQKLDYILYKNKEIQKDNDFPIIESLFIRKILSLKDILLIEANFKNKKKISSSLSGLSKEKKEIIKNHFFLVSREHKQKNIELFKQEYAKELDQIEKKYSKLHGEKKGKDIVKKIIFFVGRNFYKSKAYKNNLESKKLRLKRTFKIAILKLLKIKYLGFNVDELINKINSVNSFLELIELITKLMDIIPETKEFVEDYELIEKLDETEKIINKAEENKQKILDGEKATIKICDLLDKNEKKLDKEILDKILDENTHIVGNKIIAIGKDKQNKKQSENIGNLLDGGNIKVINHGIFAEDNSNIQQEKNKDDELEDLNQQDLELLYNELKLEFSILDKQKTNYLINDDYDNLELVIDKLTSLQIKLDKLDKIMEKLINIQ